MNPPNLVGDSNGDHFSDALFGAAKALGRPSNLATASSCQFTQASADATPNGGLAPRTRCGDYVENTFAWLSDQDPGTVVIATSGGQYFDKSADPREARDGLRRTILALEEMGHEVLIVEPIPFIRRAGKDPYWTPASCPMFSIATGACSQKMPLREAEMEQGAGWNVIREVAEENGARTLDVSHSICPSDSCLTFRDGTWIYRDSVHLSVAGSELLVPNFVEALR